MDFQFKNLTIRINNYSFQPYELETGVEERYEADDLTFFDVEGKELDHFKTIASFTNAEISELDKLVDTTIRHYLHHYYSEVEYRYL
jgi:hypothetical protein